MSQSSDTVVMVRPHHFASNPETMGDNAFQSLAKDGVNIAEAAYNEVSEAVRKLREHGVQVHLFEDETTAMPDSVFPNNWFSTHASGELVLYPMYCKNRRKERRPDIIEFLRSQYGYHELIDFSAQENDAVFLEGTGSIVFDHEHKLAYAARSKRMHESALKALCQKLGYEPVAFDATSRDGKPVYHTNVLMTVGSDFVMASVEMIRDDNERRRFVGTVAKSRKALVELTEEQIEHFAGNTLELAVDGSKLLAISSTAYNTLSADQIKVLEQWVTLVPISVPTIELGGGSIRCMLAQVFKVI
ncbi:amidinotransferase [Idiomarina sp. X4]|uniref:citrulline utilization hydrolase CtlX n=1 Tax=Idiomarina sp. X4 TaxID=2055892 RepID=UPI000C2935D8|nr:arginine deiminase-related protein [Idiomarina sp. X4]ATZ73301.1 amidinotransferase [Idiomarina sp. X4]